jgi:hypothetical protein
MKEKKEGKKDNKLIWNSLRISFFVMVGVFLILFLEGYMPELLKNILGVIFYLSLFYTFVISILHLIKYKEKTFAIISLVLSSLLIILLFLGIMILILVAYSSGSSQLINPVP